MSQLAVENGERTQRDLPRMTRREPSAFWKWVTYLVLIPLMAVWTLACGSLSLFCSLWDKSGRQQHSVAQAWAKGMLLLSGSRLTVVHPERLQRSGAAVYACNHLSYMDTPALFGTLPFQFRILANHYLFKYPAVGWHLTRSGQVPIDQSSLRSQIAGLTRGVKTLKDGMPILLFPDGSRSSDGHVRQFLSGAAFMAIKAQVPLVPLALIGTFELLPMHTYSLSPRPLLLVVGEAIDTVGMTTKNADELTQQLLKTISDMYYAYSPLDRPEQAPTNEAKIFA
ncbi:lysophospholipid acyltransferase family protein [Terriglobus aquaticus]|uniref:Lysophospholipid acyltransferase family protein n=1 Tax=Terriglobus aquaticus TaxID=940139 RepID=A0ABW9KP98_9BACT|nr:lysophospholipid acyltransferase family protein [Terriglobus aquaticus]